MTRAFLVLLPGLVLMLSANLIRAQSAAPSPPQPDLNAPDLRLDSVMRYLQATLSVADTGEGKAAAKVARFAQVGEIE